MPGPAPKPDSERRRRNATIAMTKLPAEGRKGRAPKWPLIPDIALGVRRDLAQSKVHRLQADRQDALDDGKPVGPIERRLDIALEQLMIAERMLAEQRALEAALWKDMWSLPQAVVWERLQWTRDVAQYVRHKTLAELGDMDAAREARQWSDRLGLSPMSMLRLRWEIVADEVAQRRTTPPAAPVGARGRLRVADPGAVAG